MPFNAKNVIADRCDFLPGQRINNRYLVRKVLGEGSFGIVYMVEDAGRTLACKLLRLWEVPPDIRSGLMERFEMEFKTGQINNECLVRSLDLGTVGGNPYIIMEFCPGGDLTKILGKNDRRMPDICKQILTGLQSLHANGKVHRDLKPENVLFKENGIAALTDFGIAGDRNHRMTQRSILGKPNQIFGTYAYMPPEQAGRARGGATVLPTTDIWSFGVVCFQMVTGQLPFGQLESHNDLVSYQRRGKDGQWDRNLLLSMPNGRQWERVIEGCLVPDFKHRLQTCKDVIRLLPPSQSPIVDLNSNNWHPVVPTPQPTPSTYEPKSVTRGYLLRVMQGEQYGRCFDLTQLVGTYGRVLSMGRLDDCIIHIRSEERGYVSRRHATIEQHDVPTEWVLRDGQWNREMHQWVESKNGTFVNSVPVSRNGYFLQPGDIIAIGDVTLRFENY